MALFKLIAAHGINYLDASEVETLWNLVKRLRECGITLMISGTKKQILDVMEYTGLAKTIGDTNIFSADKLAVEALYLRVDDHLQSRESKIE